MPLFDEQISRKPDHYSWAEQFMRAMWDGHWTDKEFSFTPDVHDFRTVFSDEDRVITTRCLSAIGQIEIAPKMFWAKLGDNLPHPSIRDLGYVMANIEVIHNSAYERLLEILGIEDIFEENLKLEWMNGRVNYLRKYTHKYHTDNRKQFIYSIILFTLFVENVSLFSQFYVINWYGRKRQLKHTNQQTAYTMREEVIHALVGMKLINILREEYPELFDKELEDKILSEAVEAYKAEARIIKWIVNGKQDETLNAELLCEYVKNRINVSLEAIGYSKVFSDINYEMLKHTKWFDELEKAGTKSDFFDERPTEYAKSNQVIDEESLFA